MSRAIVGVNDDYLLLHMEKPFFEAETLRFIVSFVMESGVLRIKPYLEDLASKGKKVKLLTSKYLGITEPSALYLLKDILGDNLDLRFYQDNTCSFHPKCYIFDYPSSKKKIADVFIGSSNLSASGLRGGIEWNYRFSAHDNLREYQRVSETFNFLFANSLVVTEDVLRKYSSEYKKSFIVRQASKVGNDLSSFQPEAFEVHPRGAQIEALYELKQARKEGVKKGLVVAATGVGKTFIAAFDAKDFKRVLFIAHRKEILKQAEETFLRVKPTTKIGYMMGQTKEFDCDLSLATVQTLSRDENLQLFLPDYFDYIVVDEFHHAAADSYKKILAYFTPEFLLGLTATPFRNDNQDIFELCDDNVIYEIYLKDAINRDLLAPFHYYAIYDETDYSKIDYRNGQYDIEQLERALSQTYRADLIYQKYQNMAGERTLGFCASINHADYMADYFCKNNVRAVSVHSQSADSLDRYEAIKALQKGDIQIIFAVDLFNEGVDIPSVDTVMFLRPTESMVVFLQQLGRGLRKDEHKEALIVLDFIGNYKNAHYIPALLSGENPLEKKDISTSIRNLELPEGCIANFDFHLIDLFLEMSQRDPLSKRMLREFERLQRVLGRRPTRVDIYTGSDIPMREYLKDSYLGFLEKANALGEDEKEWQDNIVFDFLKELESTRMTKAYKIPTILAMVKEDRLKLKVTLEEIGFSFQEFYGKNPLYQKELDKSQKTASWREWDNKDFQKLARETSVKFLSENKGSLFHYDEINQIFYLPSALEEYNGPNLVVHVRDILRLRTKQHFDKRFRGSKND